MFFFNEKIKEPTFTPRSIEHAYLAILNNDLNTAIAVFESLDSPRARWGKALTGILAGFMEYYPSYFEIRNFFEIDLDFFIKNEKFEYIENILGSLQILSDINQEIYKYTARVMYENKLYNAALKYMEKAKQIFYKDPELHFMFAKYYIENKNYKLANYHIDECLNIVPTYFPAIEIKKEIILHLD